MIAKWAAPHASAVDSKKWILKKVCMKIIIILLCAKMKWNEIRWNKMTLFFIKKSTYKWHRKSSRLHTVLHGLSSKLLYICRLVPWPKTELVTSATAKSTHGNMEGRIVALSLRPLAHGGVWFTTGGIYKSSLPHLDIHVEIHLPKNACL